MSVLIPNEPSFAGGNQPKPPIRQKNTHNRAIGKEITRHLFVRTGWTNFNGKNIDTANAVTKAMLIQKLGDSANRTITNIFQHPGKPLKLLSFVFILVSQK
jgi:hypothetical protein